MNGLSDANLPHAKGTTGEGGAIADEYFSIYALDRVEATTTAWLGLTMSCASCHDHKFDPLSQKEFYQMAAFFRNTTQPAMDRNAHDTNHPQKLVIPFERAPCLSRHSQSWQPDSAQVFTAFCKAL